MVKMRGNFADPVGDLRFLEETLSGAVNFDVLAEFVRCLFWILNAPRADSK
jgi:hypothetical protein